MSHIFKAYTSRHSQTETDMLTLSCFSCSISRLVACLLVCLPSDLTFSQLLSTTCLICTCHTLRLIFIAASFACNTSTYFVILSVHACLLRNIYKLSALTLKLHQLRLIIGDTINLHWQQPENCKKVHT